MYRILHENDLVRERRRGHRRRGHAPPLVHATAPNQAWTWDISRLRGPVPRCWSYLYVVLDIFSRKIVAWSIETVESDQVAKRLIEHTCTREGIQATRRRGGHLRTRSECSTLSRWRTSASPVACRGRAPAITTPSAKPTSKPPSTGPTTPTGSTASKLRCVFTGSSESRV